MDTSSLLKAYTSSSPRLNPSSSPRMTKPAATSSTPPSATKSAATPAPPLPFKLQTEAVSWRKCNSSVDRRPTEGVVGSNGDSAPGGDVTSGSPRRHRGQMKELAFAKRQQELAAEEERNRIPIAQGLPLTTDKPQVLQKPPVKQQTKPLSITLHTEERAARRAGYNELVAHKLYSLAVLKRFEEKLQKVIEEEEIKILRREMVPKAQLMPLFDRPFFPKRSNRQLTIPREPSFLSRECWTSNETNRFREHFSQNLKPVK